MALQKNFTSENAGGIWIVGDAMHLAVLKARYSITTLRSLPLGKAQLASVWPILRAAPGDRLLLHPAFVPVPDTAGLPRVLLMGDSISIGYTVAVRRELKGRANVHRAIANCTHTGKALENLERWLGDGKWKVIQFNFGLHDAVRQGQQAVTGMEEYGRNLERIVRRLKATGARLLWATTTPVPDSASVPDYDMPDLDPASVWEYRPDDIPEYNRCAAGVMRKNDISTVDLYEFARPRLSLLQQPRDIHFRTAGYSTLGGEVARAIRQLL